MSIKKMGEMIRFHRKNMGLTQKQLADLSDVGKTVVYDIEKGKMTVRFETLLKILTALNITIEFNGPLIKTFEGMQK